MAICIKNNTAPAIEIEYTSGCTISGDLPSFMLAPEPQTGYPLYTETDEVSNGWHIILPKEAYNLVTNPTFFNDLAGWSSFNSVLSRSTINSFDSGFSALIRGSGDTVTADRREYIEIEAEGFETGQIYVFSAYLWLPRLFDSRDTVMGTVSIVDDDGATAEEVFSSPIERFGQWVRVAVSKNIRTDATNVYLRVNLRSQDQRELTPPYNLTGDFNLVSEYMFADMLQFESGMEPTTPFHGDSSICNEDDDCCCDGYKWLEGAHRSISHRSACVHDSGELVSLSSLGFEILEHTGHGAPPVRDIYYDYTNRPGGKYQKTVVDTNVLTLSGFVCECSLKELECKIFGLQSGLFPDLSKCARRMLLVYVHETCNNVDCNPERYLAYCVSYIGGLEGVRNNLFQQRMALQFRAHEAFPFEWPGHTGHALSLDTLTTGAAVVKVGLGETRGFPIDNGDYRTISCIGATDRFLLGGLFDGVNSGDDSQNVTVHDCLEFCEHEFIGAVNTSIRDATGDILVGGDFIAPFRYVAIYRPDIDAWGGFDYTGGPAISLAAPFWAEVVVGSADAIHIVLESSELIFATDGPVNALVVDPSGALYAFGDFTTVNGVVTSIAKLDVNAEGCLDIANAEWEGLGFTLDGEVVTAEASGDSIYIGGTFTQATPDAVATCNEINGVKSESKGANQVVRFTDNDPAPGQLTISFEVSNIVARGIASWCLTGAPQDRMIRITAKSTLGTTYSFIFPLAAMVATDFVTVVGALYVAEITIDKSYVLNTGSCQDENQTLVDEIANDITLLQVYAALNYPAGLGVDDSLNSVTFQCVQLEQSYQGEPTELNHVAVIDGDNISEMGNGIDATVNVIHVEECTGEVLVGTDAGLYAWTGREWTEYQGNFGDVCYSSPIIDIDSCGGGDLYVLYEGSNPSLLPGMTEISYTGGVATYDFELVIQGPGKLKSFSHCNKIMRFCSELQCAETARLNFADGSFASQGRDLGASILGGSRYDIQLNTCENNLKLLVTDTDAGTKAILLYRRKYVGVEALCCSVSGRGAGAGAVDEALDFEACCNTFELSARDPSVDDCIAEGYTAGDLWLNVAGHCELGGETCPRLFVNTDDECCADDDPFCPPPPPPPEDTPAAAPTDWIIMPEELSLFAAQTASGQYGSGVIDQAVGEQWTLTAEERTDLPGYYVLGVVIRHFWDNLGTPAKPGQGPVTALPLDGLQSLSFTGTQPTTMSNGRADTCGGSIFFDGQGTTIPSFYPTRLFFAFQAPGPFSITFSVRETPTICP